ncbi:hypothetical protein [Cytobacillus purgationiresistens]|uniref:Uncharacterized protein n=1 Tax=Cytobacillus purgationiresistens TaxID=863449 RepID=A0ABU0AGL0_9BACI|nr:hypothetical protein [Cytobacillus purgationiresistens]MDQ0270401.1 hypothetical protein [Cytobacillus purgationiresistens]
MEDQSISEKIFLYFMGSMIIFVAVIGISVLLKRSYVGHTLSGTELWIILLVSFGVTVLCDMELELERQKDSFE